MLERTGVASVDEFGDKIQALLDTLDAVATPLVKKKARIMKLSRFRYRKNVNLKHVLLGTFAHLGSHIEGDFVKIKLKITDEAPFLDADFKAVKNCDDSAEAIIEFLLYIVEGIKALADNAADLINSSIEIG